MTCLRGTGELEQARALAEETANAMRVKLGGDHPLTLSGQINLANCLADAGDLDQAAALQQQAIAA